MRYAERMKKIDQPLHEKVTSLYADDSTDSVGHLIRLRLPWLLVGLCGAGVASLLVARFESAISTNIHLAFFLPAIVYMSDAVGTQTESIFVRNLARETVPRHIYFVKEFFIGIILGLVFGLLIGGGSYLWLGDSQISLVIGLAMGVTVSIAPLLALVMSSLLEYEHTDPALGAGPFTTILQQVISLSVYFLIASLILF